MPSSVSSRYLCLVGTHSDNYRLQLGSGIKCHILWCQTRPLPLPVPQAGKMSAYKSIHHFSCQAVAFGFQASFLPDGITLYDFQTSIGAVAHATFDTEHLILIPELLLLI